MQIKQKISNIKEFLFHSRPEMIIQATVITLFVAIFTFIVTYFILTRTLESPVVVG